MMKASHFLQLTPVKSFLNVNWWEKEKQFCCQFFVRKENLNTQMASTSLPLSSGGVYKTKGGTLVNPSSLALLQPLLMSCDFLSCCFFSLSLLPGEEADCGKSISCAAVLVVIAPRGGLVRQRWHSWWKRAENLTVPYQGIFLLWLMWLKYLVPQSSGLAPAAWELANYCAVALIFWFN